MDTALAAVWRTPHHFSRLPVDGQTPPPSLESVFTYLLLTTELAEADLTPHGLPTEAVSRIGYEWLASLADVWGDRPASGPPVSALTTFLKNEVGIEMPGQYSNKAVLGQPHATSIPAHELAVFIVTELPRIRDFVDSEIHPFLPELSRAATERRGPDPDAVEHPEGNGLAAAQRLLEVYPLTFDPVPMRGPKVKRTLWGLTFQNLAQRIAVELFQLFDTQPRLHRCRHCNRVFVPRTRTDSKCQADLWSPDQPSPLEFCNQQAVDAHNARFLAGEHTRERKRLHQEMRRELKRSGEGSPRAKRAKAKYEAWIQEHGKQRGPAPQPRPDLREQTD